jgi:small subunit ribosomal protein S17
LSTAGLEVAPPQRRCEDGRCPFHGHLKVRGRIFEGRIVSLSEKNFVVIEREYLHYVKKYNRYERRRSRISAHLPPCIDAREGEVARIAECRPLSKTISFVVVSAGGR